jgi:hypothetical protein
MQRIHHSETGATLWRGTTYIVDGKPGTADPPLVLLDEVNPEPPQYDPSTQTLEQSRSADLAAKEWRTVWTIRDLTPEEIAAANALPPVTPRQFRLALLGIGISPAAISAMLANDEAALTEWEHAQEIRRDHPLVESLRLALGKSPEQVDAVFAAASAL